MPFENTPVIPLRGGVVFPHQVIPLRLSRDLTRRALEAAQSEEGLGTVLIAVQRDPDQEHPATGEDFYPYGVMATVVEVAGLRNEAVLHTSERVRFRKIWLDEEGLLRGSGAMKPFPTGTRHPRISRMFCQIQETLLRMAELDDRLKSLAKDVQEISPEDVQEAVYLLGTFYPEWDIPQRIRLLSASTLEEALHLLLSWLEEDLGRMELQARIHERVHEWMERQEKKFFLQELQELERELGLTEEGEFQRLEEEIRAAGMPEEVQAKALQELARLRCIPPMSPESGMIRSYLDWLIALPWNRRSPDRLDLAHVRKVLDEDHYGLEEPKERILEYLASVKLKGEIRGQVICFVGPPGVGKTSLARSIARALGRPFVRMSLGGLRDEAEIRGHRRTYLGALPGRIIQMIRRAGVKNPLMLLDEIDKLGRDGRGDPYAALMEVLDPELNSQFQDHYLEVDFDLSEVLFITTANNPYAIPPPLYDRMEMIPIRGYLETEKFFIAWEHLIPKKRKEVGLPEDAVRVTDGAVRRIIRAYTREAGVRELERQIRRLFLKVARRYVEEGKPVHITQKNLPAWLGVPRYEEMQAETSLPPGVAYAMAWSETGGTLLRIEVSLYPGKGNLNLTGSLGDVMKESACIAFSLARTLMNREKPGSTLDGVDVHIHVPEGAIPKDGPSAGLPIFIALISALSGRRVPGTVAFTGEITLTGKILPVGGLSEKLVAAKRQGIRTVYLPRANRPRLEEVPESVREGLEIAFAESVPEVLHALFGERVFKEVRIPWTLQA